MTRCLKNVFELSDLFVRRFPNPATRIGHEARKPHNTYHDLQWETPRSATVRDNFDRARTQPLRVADGASRSPPCGRLACSRLGWCPDRPRSRRGERQRSEPTSMSDEGPNRADDLGLKNEKRLALGNVLTLYCNRNSRPILGPAPHTIGNFFGVRMSACGTKASSCLD